MEITKKIPKLLEGKAGLITGAGSGIGRATAIVFAMAGAKVLICGRTVSKLEETAKMVREKGGVCEIVQCDLKVEEQVKAMVDKTVELFGKLDFAVNAAAIDQPAAPVWERDAETFRNVVETNLFGDFYLIKHEGAVMVKQGFGAICNVSSGAGDVGCAGQEPYSAAKAGLNNLTKSAAIGMGPYGVRVNAILPGVTMTPMIDEFFKNFPEIGSNMVKAIPLGRTAQPEEQATAALFLCSDLASDITGVWLKVDGGYQAGYYTKAD